MNAGKVAITQNPLSISWAQWLAFFRYFLPQMHWTLVGKERGRQEFVKGKLDDEWRKIEEAFAADFRIASMEQAIL